MSNSLAAPRPNASRKASSLTERSEPWKLLILLTFSLSLGFIRGKLGG
jgi:hypothetical protein